MSEDRKECHKCLSFNRCFGGVDYGSIYCVANRKYRRENDSIYDTKLAVMQQQINEKDKRIQELENKLLDVIHGTEIIKNETPEYIKENYIPKQVVNLKIANLKKQIEEKDKILDEVNSVIKKQQGTETDLDAAYQYYDETYDEKQKLNYQVNILEKLLEGEK